MKTAFLLQFRNSNSIKGTFIKGRALWKGIKGDEWALLIRLINVTLHLCFIFTIISKVKISDK